MKRAKTLGLLALLAFSLAFPFLFSNPAITTIAVFTLLFAAAGTGWNIFSGYTRATLLSVTPPTSVWVHMPWRFYVR